MSELEGSVSAKQALEGEMLPKGNDGISPTIDTEKIDGGHRVTITDIHGQKSFDIIDGSSDLLVVQVASDGKVSHSVDAINAAMRNGASVVLVLNGKQYHLDSSGGHSARFVRYRTEKNEVILETVTVDELFHSEVTTETVVSSPIFVATEDTDPMEVYTHIQNGGNVVAFLNGLLWEISEASEGGFGAFRYAIRNNTLFKESATIGANKYFGSVVVPAEEFGARSSSWMPSATDIGARPMNWLPTPEQIGAASKSELAEATKEKPWELIHEETLKVAVSEVRVSFAEGKYKEVYVEADTTIETTETNSKSVRFIVGNYSKNISAFDKSVTNGKKILLRVHGYHSPSNAEVYDLAVSDYGFILGDLQRNVGNTVVSEHFADIRIVIGNSTVHSFAAGSTFKIWGR